MSLNWSALTVDDDTDDDLLRYYTGDPADLFDAAAELMQALRPPVWHEHAACRGKGVDLFFVGRGESLAPARALCATCPVFADCQATALDDPDLAGVWAGLTVAERRALRRGAA